MLSLIQYKIKISLSLSLAWAWKNFIKVSPVIIAKLLNNSIIYTNISYIKYRLGFNISSIIADKIIK
jgi:hypothetical protein